MINDRRTLATARPSLSKSIALTTFLPVHLASLRRVYGGAVENLLENDVLERPIRIYCCLVTGTTLVL